YPAALWIAEMLQQTVQTGRNLDRIGMLSIQPHLDQLLPIEDQLAWQCQVSAHPGSTASGQTSPVCPRVPSTGSPKPGDYVPDRSAEPALPVRPELSCVADTAATRLCRLGFRSHRHHARRSAQAPRRATTLRSSTAPLLASARPALCASAQAATVPGART